MNHPKIYNERVTGRRTFVAATRVLTVVISLPAFIAILFSPSTVRSGPTNEAAGAVAPNGGFVLSHDSRYWIKDIPETLKTRLNRSLSPQTPLRDVAFTPDGKGWAVTFHGGAAWYHNPSSRFAAAVDDIVANNQHIHAFAFNPVNWQRDYGFVIVHDGGIASHNVPDGLLKRLQEIRQNGETVQDVAFAPNGDWIATSRNIRWTTLRGQFLKDVNNFYNQGGTAKDVIFNRAHWGNAEGWLFLDSGSFFGRRMPTEISNILRNKLAMSGTNKDPYKFKTVNPEMPEPEVSPKIDRVDLPDASIKITEFEVMEHAEKNDDPGVLIIGFRGRAGEGGKVWFDEKASNPLLVGKIAKGQTLHFIGDELEVEFNKLRPYTCYGTIYYFLERDKTPNKEWKAEKIAVAQRKSRNFSSEMNALRRPASNAPKSAKIALAKKMAIIIRDHIGGASSSHIETNSKKARPNNGEQAKPILVSHMMIPDLTDGDLARVADRAMTQNPKDGSEFSTRSFLKNPGKHQIIVDGKNWGPHVGIIATAGDWRWRAKVKLSVGE